MGGAPIGLDVKYENVRLVVSDGKVTLVFLVEKTGDVKEYHFDQKTGQQE